MLKTVALLCIGLFVTGGAPSRADELTPEKIDDIKALMSITMPRETDLAVWSRQVEAGMWMLKQRDPSLSEQQIRSLSDEAIRLYGSKRDAPGGLTDRLVEIYHKHLSDDDVKQILEFFKTSTGQKVKSFLATRQIEATPIIQQFQQEVMTEWGKAVIEILIKQSMPPPMQAPR